MRLLRSAGLFVAAGILVVSSAATLSFAHDTPAAPQSVAKSDDKPDVETHSVATIETPRGTIRIRLFPEEAPKTVANFIKLANRGFYDGLVFHRVEPGSLIQGGASRTGSLGYTIPDEKNKKLKHIVGAVAMAKTNAPNSADSQFYIVIGKPATALDGKYTVFGQVIEGQSAANSMRRNDPMYKVSIMEPAPLMTEKKPVPEETPKAGTPKKG